MRKKVIAIVSIVTVCIGFFLALANGEYGGDIHFVQQHNHRTGEMLSIWGTIFSGVITVGIMNFIPACVTVTICGSCAALLDWMSKEPTSKRKQKIQYDMDVCVWFPFKLSYCAAFLLWLLQLFNIVELNFVVL